MSVIYRKLHRVDFSLFIQDPRLLTVYGLGFLFYKFCFENIISIFLAYFAMEYLCYVSMTPFSFWSQLLFPKKKKKRGGPMLGLWDLRTDFL